MLLPQALSSALRAAPDEDVEVIVVPNGPDDSWKTIAESFKDDQRVQWHPISRAHANAARNEGKRVASGKYLWFLDDDDYFLPGATKVIELAEKESLEIASAPVELVAHDGQAIKKLDLAPINDFTSSLLSPERRTGFQFHVFLRISIYSLWLNEEVNIGQDTHWAHYLCRLREWSWGKAAESGCTWRQHYLPQISKAFGPSEHLKLQEQLLWETIEHLIHNNRLTNNRPYYAAHGMWNLLHAGFFMSPRYWYPVMKKVQAHFPGTYPNVAIYNKPFGRWVPPVLLESIMLPKRWLNHLKRQRLVKQGKINPWEL